MENRKDTMKTLAQRSKKKKFIVIGSVLAVALICVVYIGSRAMAASQTPPAQTLETDEVSVKSLVQSVGTTGTVVSIKNKDLTVSLTNVDVTEVFASVGDVVEEGTVLMAFDTSDIEDSLADAQKSLSTAQQQNSLSAQDAARSVGDAQRTASYQTESADAKVESAYNDYLTTQKDYNDASNKLSDLNNSESAAYNTYLDKKSIMESAQAEMETKKAALDSVSVSGNEADVADAQTAYDAALAAYNMAAADCQSAETAYNAAKASWEAQDSTVRTLMTKYNTAAMSYDSAKRDYDNTVASQSSSVANAQNSQKSASLNANTDSQQNQVEQYEQQLENGILTAPFSGVITAVNYDAGDTYNGGAVITLQDCSSYEIKAQIDEYDISYIKLGQQVLIKTNATGDEELKGEVTFISPTATQGVASGDITYEVRIAITTPNERLKLDMSARLSIIIESHENVYAVPYNAVETDEEGNAFITEVGEDGVTTTKIPVTVVLESNYYTEIESGDIYEGQKILVIESDESNDTGMQGYETTMGGF